MRSDNSRLYNLNQKMKLTFGSSAILKSSVVKEIGTPFIKHGGACAHCKSYSLALAIAGKMGGMKKFDYPKYVWSPCGGWWCQPRNWKRNLVIAYAVAFLACIPVVKYGLDNERRIIPPHKVVPWQKWAKHAEEDDPRLRKA
eukprot:gene8105-8975_t